MKNYRKAKQKEVCCCDCRYHRDPVHNYKRMVCIYRGIIGKKHTCDAAITQEAFLQEGWRARIKKGC